MRKYLDFISKTNKLRLMRISYGYYLIFVSSETPMTNIYYRLK